jgi:Predicted hydrolases or acyltransferases (alpha/beta hydrolase superfamily)
MSAAFEATPMAHYFADLFMERNEYADVDSIIYQFEALAAPDPDDLHSGITCPSIILSGSEDNAHPRAPALKERIPGCELKTLPGAGHACQLEQPWLFDRFMIEFLSKNGLFPNPCLPPAPWPNAR